MSGEQPVQLRLGFSAPTRPQGMYLSLAGLTVLVEPSDGNYDLSCAYLAASGIPAQIEPAKGLHFPVRHLPALGDLPDHVDMIGDEFLSPLLDLVLHPSADDLPATLVLSHDGSLSLSWFDGTRHHEEPFVPAAATALLMSEIPFVATSETWDALKANCRLPVLAGRARVNLDGYVEISTTKPQLVELSPLPALFRIDDTHFGLPLAYADAIDADPSFVWEGYRPTYERAPDALPHLPFALSRHSESDLRLLVESLAAQRAEVVIWESGLGRRVFCLSAIEILDAYPLLIVAPPSAVWAWQRHLDLLGRSHSLLHDRADVHIITYRDLVSRQLLTSPAAVIFDDLAGVEFRVPAVQAALHRLDGVLDAYRLATSQSFPDDPKLMVEMMAVLRPGEFRSDVALAQRYPVNTIERVHQHVEAYVSRRVAADPGTDLAPPFKRSSVTALEPSEAQVRAFEDALARPAAPADSLAELLGIVSAGSAHATSPKVVAAASRARRAVSLKRSVALLTRYPRTAQLLRAMLRPLSVHVTDGSTLVQHNDVVVVIFDSRIPDLRSFDEVVVVDYPWSTSLLDAAVGSSAEEAGVQQVTFLHLRGTVDDRLAMLSAQRRERATLIEAAAPPSPQEIAYLLSPRT